MTSGLTGADLASILNLAAIRAASEGAPSVGPSHVDAARDKVLMGLARPSAVVSAAQRRLTAVHEAGHVVVARHTEGARPVEKVSISLPHACKPIKLRHTHRMHAHPHR